MRYMLYMRYALYMPAMRSNAITGYEYLVMNILRLLPWATFARVLHLCNVSFFG